MQGIYRRDEANLLAFNSALAGAGLKPEHATEVLGGAHAVDFFEVHAGTTWETAVRLIACSSKSVPVGSWREPSRSAAQAEKRSWPWFLAHPASWLAPARAT